MGLIEKKSHDCSWTGWLVTTMKTYKEIGTSLHHKRRLLLRKWCSHAPRCKQRCMYNGLSRTRSPFPEDQPGYVAGAS